MVYVLHHCVHRVCLSASSAIAALLGLAELAVGAVLLIVRPTVDEVEGHVLHVAADGSEWLGVPADLQKLLRHRGFAVVGCHLSNAALWSAASRHETSRPQP